MVPALLPESAQLKNRNIIITSTSTGFPQLTHRGYKFNKNNATQMYTYWRCVHARAMACRARIVTSDTVVRITNPLHTHPPMDRLLYGAGLGRTVTHRNYE
jgi:hypothetical protein